MKTVQDVLDECKVQYRTEGPHTRPGWFQSKCYFCRGGTTPGKPYLGISKDSGTVHCWRCGTHSLLDLVIAATGRGFVDAKELVRGVEYTPAFKVKKTGTLKLPSGVGPLMKAHKRYLKNRGFDPDELERVWGVQGIGNHPRLAWRIFIPIKLRGETVSWTTRSIDATNEKRYISASESEESIAHKSLLLGEDLAYGKIVVHEGPFDVFRTGPGAVCTFGVKVTDAQLWRIAQYSERIVCFDNEKEAQKRAETLCKSLVKYRGVTRRVCVNAKDVAVMSERQVKEFRSLFLS